ncbi:MAG: hypothetical protein RBU21_02680 [FCB group bacterium]|jgi:hypothetical protein|nr:hypothetical protein [FCB group bacterium]
MHKAMRIATIAALLFASAVSAHADFGFGNPEEPALRPYKGLWRGVKALTYNLVKSLDTGNRKFPGLGVVELGRGTRYGAVELAYSTYMGMAGSRPAPVKSYSWPNEVLDSDWLLRNTADLAGGAIFWGHGGSFESNAVGAAGVFTAQKVVDHSPVLSEREKELYLTEKPQYAAQRDYLGKRAIKPRENGRTDFIARARRQRIVTSPVLPPNVIRVQDPRNPSSAGTGSLPSSNPQMAPVSGGAEQVAVPEREISPLPSAPLETR